MGTITLDETGRGVFDDALPFGKYYILELQTSPYYRLNETKYPIDISYAGQDKAIAMVQVNNGGTIPNELKLGKIVVEKQGEVFVGATKTKGGYTPIYELRGLPGAVFDIVAGEDIYDVSGKLVASKGTVMDTVTTGEDGRAESKLLRLGHYELVETAVPAGFVLDVERYAATLDFDGEVKEVITKQAAVLNERIKADIRVKKLWELPDNPPKDFAPWKDIQFGLCAEADILGADGKVAIPAGRLIETVAIDKDGNGAVTTDLPFGSYYIQELNTAKGYTLDETKHDIIFAPGGGQSVVIISISAENKIERGSLKVNKTFEGRKAPIPGVPFTIVGQTAFGKIRIESKTDANGEILVEGLPVGEYVVTELESELTLGYILSEAQTVTVAADKLAELEILNVLERGSLKIVKTFEGVKKPIAGVKFTVEGVTVGGERFFGEYETDKKGEILIKDLPVGEYVIKEIACEANLGYILAEEQTVTIACDKLTELAIENKRIIGLIKIHKLDAETGKPVEGAEFGLYKDGKQIAKAASDADGWALFVNIPYGDYEVRELKAAPGYKKTDAVYKVEIRRHDIAVEFEVPNEPLPPGEITPLPKTGDSLLIVGITLGVLAFAGAGAVLLLRKRRREEEPAEPVEVT